MRKQTRSDEQLNPVVRSQDENRQPGTLGRDCQSSLSRHRWHYYKYRFMRTCLLCHVVQRRGYNEPWSKSEVCEARENQQHSTPDDEA